MKRTPLICFLFLGFITSCQQDKKEENALLAKKSFAPPVKILPIPNSQRIAANPSTVNIPSKTGGSYVKQTESGLINIRLLPSQKRPADFYSNMQSYNTENGLVLSAVNCCFCDKLGNLWFGTAGGGISKYDGKGFTNYTTIDGLANNVINAITEDREGNIWVGTSDGISRFNGRSFTNYGVAQGLIHYGVNSISIDTAGNLWFGTSGGVSRYNYKVFTNYTTLEGLTNNVVRCILIDKHGNIWFGTQNGVSKYDGKTFSNFTEKEGLPTNFITGLAEDKTGNIWICTGSGLSKYDGKRFSNFTKNDGLISNDISGITEDKAGNIWLSAYGGVSRYDGESFVNYTIAQGLPSNSVTSVIEDNAGNFWFTTAGAGVCRYEGQAVTTLTKAQGLPDDIITSIIEDRKGRLLFGSLNNGVSYYDDKSFINYSSNQGLAGNGITAILNDSKGNYWFGTSNDGISRFDGRSFVNYSNFQGLTNNTVTSIIEDKKGNIWIGTFEGINKYDGTSFSSYTTSQGLLSNFIYAITEDKTGNIWIGTSAGISKFDGKYFINYDKSQGLINADIHCITEDKDGNIWFGTAGGVSKYNGNGFTNYTTQQGLVNDYVTSIITDQSGNFIIGTNDGISVLKFKGESFTFENFNQKTGYPIKDVNGGSGNGAMICDRKGIIWAGTGDKLVRFDYNAIHRSKSPANLVLQSLKVNNENISWYDLLDFSKRRNLNKLADSNSVAANIVEEVTVFGKILKAAERDSLNKLFGDIKFDSVTKFYPIPYNLVLPYAHNNITLEFNAIELARPYLVRYQYVLEGYDKEWNPVTNKTTASYGNIDEGTYTFKLKAQSPDGIWSEPITYSFKVLPPWYRTWWMYLFYVVGGLTTIWFIFKWRMAELRKEKEILEVKVQERTIEVVKQKEEIEEQKIQIEISHRKVSDSINYAQKIQYSILPPEDEMKKYFPEHFVYFQPKDIISGDFYWFYHHNGFSYAAAADCTGHGVPGALMSMTIHSLLNEVMMEEKLANPGEILGRLHRSVYKTLQQHKGDEYSQDGCDISLSVIDHANKLLHFSGARNHAYLTNGKDIAVLKATSKSIGGLSMLGEPEPERKFKSETIELKEDVLLVMSTDGIFDQLNDQDESFGNTRFKEMINAIYSKPINEGGGVVSSTINDWKKELHPQDDMLVMGFMLRSHR